MYYRNVRFETVGETWRGYFPETVRQVIGNK
jgi:hypothetical protein